MILKYLRLRLSDSVVLAQAPDDYLGVAPVFSLCSASDGQRRRRMAMASRAWSSASKKGVQPSLVQALELPPLFSALSSEGERSGRDKYDLDFEFWSWFAL